jgi:hypothetical protein
LDGISKGLLGEGDLLLGGSQVGGESFVLVGHFGGIMLSRFNVGMETRGSQTLNDRNNHKSDNVPEAVLHNLLQAVADSRDLGGIAPVTNAVNIPSRGHGREQAWVEPGVKRRSLLQAKS